MKTQTRSIDKETLAKATALNEKISNVSADVAAMFTVLPALLKEVERLKAGPSGWSEDFQRTILRRVGLENEFAAWGIDATEAIGRALVKTRIERDVYRQGLFKLASMGCEIYGMFNLANVTGASMRSCGRCGPCNAVETIRSAQEILESGIGPQDETQKVKLNVR